MRKHILMRALCTLMAVLAFMPMLAQDFLTLHMKDGSKKRYYWAEVKELKQSKMDADGQVHADYCSQMIKIGQNVYYIPLSDIESIDFTKVDEEKTMAQQQQAAEKAQDYFASANTASEMARHKDELTRMEGVEKVTANESEVTIHFDNGQKLSYYFPPVEEEELDEAEIKAQLDELLRQNNNINRVRQMLYNYKPRLVIADMTVNDHARDGNRTRLFEKLKLEYNNHGYVCDYVDNVTVDFLSSGIFEYDLVLLITHGGIEKEDGRHWLLTNELLAVSDGDSESAKEEGAKKALEAIRAKYKFQQNGSGGKYVPNNINIGCVKERLSAKSYRKSFSYYVEVSDEFIMHHAEGRFSGDGPHVVFTSACHAMEANDNLAKAFVARGATSFYGYNQTNGRGPLAGTLMYLGMLNGCSDRSSFLKLPDYVVNTKVYEDGAFKNSAILTPYPRYKEIDTEDRMYINGPEVSALFSMDKKQVTLYATVPHNEMNITYTRHTEDGKLLDSYYDFTPEIPSFGSCGFEISHDPEMVKDVKKIELKPEFTEDDHYGTRTIVYDIPERDPQESYYRAYIYDGKYRYSETKVLAGTKLVKKVTLDSPVTIGVGQTFALEYGFEPADATITAMAWTSSDPTVVSVDKKGVVKGLQRGQSTVTMTTTDGSNLSATCTVTVVNAKEHETMGGHEYVNLGLPSGTLWASCNIGAETKEQAGSHFAWGETNTKDVYNWNTYAWCESGNRNLLTKYCLTSRYGTVDKNARLDPEDDAAHILWGYDWCMPTIGEFQELCNSEYTTTTMTTINGMPCVEIKSKINGECIYLPAAGSRAGDSPNKSGNTGYYWSSTIYPEESYKAQYLVFNDYGNPGIQKDERYYGLSIRPVRHAAQVRGSMKNGHEYVDLGLSVMWATCNVGAKSCEETGDHFAWGDIDPKEDYTSPNSYDYKWYDNNTKKYTKYSSKVDGLRTLQRMDDAATMHWGSTWRIPMAKHLDELRKKCTFIDYTENGVKGKLVIGPSGRSIFLPFDWYDEMGYYWSSYLTEYEDLAYQFYIERGNCSIFETEREELLMIRPVFNPNEVEPILVTSITLDRASAEMYSGESITLNYTCTPSNADTSELRWTTSNEFCVKVVNGKLTAIAPGSCVISVIAYDNVVAKCLVTVSDRPGTYASVDLGLSVKWAACNVGASTPEDYGNYFAWGETTGSHEGKTDFSLATYKFNIDGKWDKMTKYVTNSNYGVRDDKSTLDPEDDAAHVNLGEKWRMPTRDEWKELFDDCDWTRTQLNGVNGYKVVGKNGNCIFVPISSEYKTPLDENPTEGYYWTSNGYNANAFYAEIGTARNTYKNVKSAYRYEGLNVRGVCP